MDISKMIIGQMPIKHDKYFIAGPCSFATYEELLENVIELKKLGVEYVRTGIFKPRTSPYSFQGLREDGISLIQKLKDNTNIKVVAELTSIDQIKKYSQCIDVIQIGSRNMYNYEMLKCVGRLNKPIILKRGISATIEEWLMAAEYIAKEGNTNIILCERGIRSFDRETRNVLDLQAVAIVKKLCNLPVIVDPSHASGRRDIIEEMSKAAMACGANGLMIESHINPDLSMSDRDQTVSIDVLARVKNFYDEINI